MGFERGASSCVLSKFLTSVLIFQIGAIRIVPYFITRFRDMFYLLILLRFSNRLWFNVVLKKTLKEIFSASTFCFL